MKVENTDFRFTQLTSAKERICDEEFDLDFTKVRVKDMSLPREDVPSGPNNTCALCEYAPTAFAICRTTTACK